MKGKDMNTSLSMLLSQFAAAWDVGVRLDFGFLLLRLDLGLRLHDPARASKWLRPGQWFRRDGYALHFGVGYPF